MSAPSRKKPGPIESLERAGVFTIQTEQLKDRLKGFDELKKSLSFEEKDTPFETLNEYESRIRDIASLVRKHATPWAKAASDPLAGALVDAWEKIGSIAKKDIMLTRELLLDYDRLSQAELTEQAKKRLFDISWQTVRMEMMIVEKEYISRTLILAQRCWRAEDITTEPGVTIQTNYPARIERQDITRDDLFGTE